MAFREIKHLVIPFLVLRSEDYSSSKKTLICAIMELCFLNQVADMYEQFYRNLMLKNVMLKTYLGEKNFHFVNGSPEKIIYI